VDYPEQLKYTTEHEWVDLSDEGPARVGITSFAADALGDIVYVQLPPVGSEVRAGEACGELESTKSVNDLFAPVSGEVVEINDVVDADPSLVNSDPYGEGWLFKVTVTDEGDLMSAEEYVEHVSKG
jgi:glycine cleavage system H protein